MKIYIKQNSIVTEENYTDILETILQEEGFIALEVPNRTSEQPYTFDDFEFVSGKWKLKE